MRYVWAVVCCLVISGVSLAQDSRADVYGGYSYVNIDTNGLSSRQNANGWEAAVSGNFNKWFAVEGDVNGYYKSYSANLSGVTAKAKITDYSYAGGPRLNFKPVFIHALFGGDHLIGTATATGVSGSLSESQDGIAGLAGGGAEWRVSGRWSARVSGDYVFTRHNILGGSSVTQNDFRAGVGIVYSFGGRRESKRAEEAPQPSSPSTRRSPGVGMRIEVLGVTVTLGQSAGAEITDEAPNGAVALAGLHPGDVINAVDGRSVKAPKELAAELANRPAGDKVRLGYLIHGAWQTETMVVLNATH